MKIRLYCCIVYNKILFSLFYFFHSHMCNENMISLYKCATKLCFHQKGNFGKTRKATHMDSSISTSGRTNSISPGNIFVTLFSIHNPLVFLKIFF